MSLDADIVVVGAGPAGLAFCRSLAQSPVSIIVVEKQAQESIAKPQFDGREIALTHASRHAMEKFGIWEHVPSDEIYLLRDAKVLDGTSDYLLHFPQPDSSSKKEGLGYFIANHNIRQASYDAVSTQDNVQIRYGHGVADVALSEKGAVVSLEDGSSIKCRLVVAADSRFSNTRRKMGIGADWNDFGRTVHVFRMEHSISNEHTAIECFSYGRTLAILPLDEHLCSCVVTIDSHRAHEISDLSPEDLEQTIMEQLKHRLGQMKFVEKMVSYPLVGGHAKQFYGQSCAVIGDAAVGMHPVTAHGYNLGLQSAVILGQLIDEAACAGQDIASARLLSRYNIKHMMSTRTIYHGTNFVVKLFTAETPPAKLLRKAVMRISNNLPPVKYLISRQLTHVSHR